MRAHYIKDHQKHVFEPMMKRCLEEKPAARGTFEDALEEIQIYLKKYAKNNQAETLEGNKVKVQFSHCVFSAIVQKIVRAILSYYNCICVYVCMCPLCRKSSRN